MRFDIITIFPEIFDSYFSESILKRAQQKKLIEIKVHNLRDYTADKHKTVDDKPYGGGPGMVMRIEPLIKAVQFAKSKIKNQKSKIILFFPAGKQFDNKMAIDLAKEYKQLILICGRYEGVDERIQKVIRNWKLEISELSIGPYVLTGGEIPAMVLIDSVSRQIPGVLGKTESLEEKRFGAGLPVYTRPEHFVFKNKKYRVPKVLLSGNHQLIEKWRKKRLKND
jgi:tRNA (guanine37-N1)-methyltransferase